MFEVSVEQSFAAGHALRNYKGACENVHGHNFKIRVTIEGHELDGTGMLVDFLDVKHSMGEVIARLDHRFLNDVPPFDVKNPSAENIAKHIFDEATRQMKPVANGAGISGVTVWESDITAATYRP